MTIYALCVAHNLLTCTFNKKYPVISEADEKFTIKADIGGVLSLYWCDAQWTRIDAYEGAQS